MQTCCSDRLQSALRAAAAERASVSGAERRHKAALQCGLERDRGKRKGEHALAGSQRGARGQLRRQPARRARQQQLRLRQPARLPRTAAVGSHEPRSRRSAARALGACWAAEPLHS